MKILLADSIRVAPLILLLKVLNGAVFAPCSTIPVKGSVIPFLADVEFCFVFPVSFGFDFGDVVESVSWMLFSCT